MYYKEGKSQKHLSDIQNILEISSELIDFENLERFIEKYYLKREWKLIKEASS